ncbi:M16 family metallopeptidase [Rosenbergiella australiborealis]|uniref:Insulinase family protein n=1 Tax=Rosenbergiella australiborealis TaxID=1544696 RepID=A0ABS5T572_9GAMM|nr:pitrilysin family protein [Rosenbergiella australiborealis]MBT0727509.1 insulinase family protein [Rosenbergiella australiborealis]
MPGIKSLLWVGGMLFSAFSLTVNAEPLHPDPAWQQGQLSNGFGWQVLSTPQRPSDHIEIRLVVNTGSLSESPQQTGFSHLLARLAMVHNLALTPEQQRVLWHADMAKSGALPPVITSYDYTQYNLSLPVNRPELIKSALDWLAATAGDMQVTPTTVATALKASDPTATWPDNTQDQLWRYRLQNSALLSHDPSQQPSSLTNVQPLAQYYHQWYTPDAMTLYIVGNVDNRALIEQINKAFSPLKGKRKLPTPVPVLSPLSSQPTAIVDNNLHASRLVMNWDAMWLPIQDSQSLKHYWLSDLTREALYWHLQPGQDTKDTALVPVDLQCQVLFARAQCGLKIDAEGENLTKQFAVVGREIVKLRDQGLTQDEFDRLITKKTNELSGLFATYARTSTDILMMQRLRSLQNAMVDIAPEQYQKLRQEFLSGLTLDAVNHELHQQLSQPISLVLLHPSTTQTPTIEQLQAEYNDVTSEGDGSHNGAGSSTSESN